MSRREGLSVADPLVTPVREQPSRLYGRVCAELPVLQEVEYPTLVQKANDLYTNVVGFLQAHGQPVEEDYVKTLVIRNLRQWGVRRDTIPSDAELQELLFCAIHLHEDDSGVDGQAVEGVLRLYCNAVGVTGARVVLQVVGLLQEMLVLASSPSSTPPKNSAVLNLWTFKTDKRLQTRLLADKGKVGCVRRRSRVPPPPLALWWRLPDLRLAHVWTWRRGGLTPLAQGSEVRTSEPRGGGDVRPNSRSLTQNSQGKCSVTVLGQGPRVGSDIPPPPRFRSPHF
uniref:Uncharacterized protein n=1 Tax=Chromera velia CCMP2878 TaxID=1169474 RepID=A0A0G4HAB7_9ALVE|eukprot:Cvel_25649.t1-p1 / transcript=Cvel_25649.t1 / gene=Cvel_25649 / organism=Chromera_velia_CCMP2878 / gene_product=hypothetical protein / transcript_product=hypothetical protein / location=Cvel_scaffold2935:104-15631(-) / protein_length=282 / sequence_SO=supercontig / SO=protein_coding / is_pseudo=false